jgi:hypothetical protein
MLKLILQGIRQILKGLVALPGDLLRMLRGESGPALPPLETPYEDGVERLAATLRKELIELPAEAARKASTLGGRIHAYAAGDRQARDAFDVSGIPDHVAVALLTMEPHQLTRLAAAGPDACGKWAEGGKTGLVGVPPCRKACISGSGRDEGTELPSAPARAAGSLRLPGMRPTPAA